MFSIRHRAIAAAIALSACGGGGTADANLGAGAASYGALAWVDSTPTNGAVQVATNETLRVRFGSRVLLESLRRDDTTLCLAGDSEPIAGTWRLSEDGASGLFSPAAPLQPETDYVLTVSALTCDGDARILDLPATVAFRTMDATPPTVAACNITPSEIGRSRTSPILVTATEALDPASIDEDSVRLIDQFGASHGLSLVLNGATLSATPRADLPGDRGFTLTLSTTAADRAGNHFVSDWSVAFRTAADATAPRALSIWPASNASGMSPAIEPTVHFDEAMDPASIEATSVLFQDEFGGLVAFHAESSLDQRTLRLCPSAPLSSGRRYTLAFLVSAGAVTDVSGNTLGQTLLTSFSVGSDASPPTIASVEPQSAATRVSPNVAPTVVFTEAIDALSVSDATVRLMVLGNEVPCTLSMPNASTLQLEPVFDLEADSAYTIELQGGPTGLRDPSGNFLATNASSTFTTSADPVLPTATLQPSDGATGVPPAMRASIVFASAMEPASIGMATVELRTDAGQSIPAQVALVSGNRVVTIQPLVALQPNSYYRTFVRGGQTGVRAASGNWLPQDLNSRFRIGTAHDFAAPVVNATVNGIDSSRRTGLVLPTHGFTVQMDAVDGTQTPDVGSVRVDFVGDGIAPADDALWATASIGYRTFHASLPQNLALTPGTWTMSVRVADLSGNVGVSAPLTFTVVEPAGGLVPFERTQVIWARTDLDRDDNGRGDFEDDMLRLGLATGGDPLGTNAYVRDLARDAILAHANQLFGRGPDGAPIDSDSVGVRFTHAAPAGLPHMQMALGGFDPQGSRGRAYGSATSGVLGRAYYDLRNANINDRNIGTSPGLGVFPAEMFLYQADLHQQLYPSFVTMFAQRFLSLCPDMGGTPVGSNPVDAQVFQSSFDLANATSAQLARRNAVLRAVEDWGKAIGTVLAHETGHSVGLVAPGPAPSGLFGDSSLHNANASAAEVMAAAVGYEAMVSLEYAFRDTDAAYLRHRIFVR